MAHCRQRQREPEIGNRCRKIGERETPHTVPHRRRHPCDGRADCNRNQSGRHAFEIPHSAEPTRKNDGEAHDADHRRHVHLERGTKRDERNGNTRQRTEQRCARRHLTNERRDKTAAHEHEALNEHPRQPRLPRFHRITRLERDRQHDDEGHDEHMRHTDARWQRTHIRASRLCSKTIRKPCVIKRAHAEHETGRRQNTTEHQRIRHLDHEAQQPRQHEQIHQDIGAETEERVPVTRDPEFRFVYFHCASQNCARR